MEMSEEKIKFCPYCGTQIDYKYTTCPSCGKPQPSIDGITSQRSAAKKNALLAAILSLLITGAGQIYLGRVWRGLAYLVTVLLLGILFDGILTVDELLVVGVVFSIISAWDAYRIANEINRS
jgi:TM2 domain-containing membrane protein YozV